MIYDFLEEVVVFMEAKDAREEVLQCPFVKNGLVLIVLRMIVIWIDIELPTIKEGSVHVCVVTLLEIIYIII